jgi:hypothetical protein
MKKAKKKKGIFYSHFFSTLFWDHHRGARSSFSLPFVYLLSSSRPVVQSSSSFPNNTREPSQREWTQHCSTPSRVTFCGTSNRVCVLSLSLSRERERERGFDSSGTQCLRFPIYRVVATSRVFAKSRTRSSN